MKTPNSLVHERIDDIPLLIGLAQKLRLPELLDRHLGNHGKHQGLSNGTLAAGWIAFILSRGNHTKVHVEEWTHGLHHTLSHLLGQPLRSAEFSDDRLGILLRRLQELDDWAALEADLWHGTCEVYELPLERVAWIPRPPADTTPSLQKVLCSWDMAKTTAPTCHNSRSWLPPQSPAAT